MVAGLRQRQPVLARRRLVASRVCALRSLRRVAARASSQAGASFRRLQTRRSPPLVDIVAGPGNAGCQLSRHGDCRNVYLRAPMGHTRKRPPLVPGSARLATRRDVLHPRHTIAGNARMAPGDVGSYGRVLPLVRFSATARTRRIFVTLVGGDRQELSAVLAVAENTENVARAHGKQSATPAHQAPHLTTLLTYTVSYGTLECKASYTGYDISGWL